MSTANTKQYYTMMGSVIFCGLGYNYLMRLYDLQKDDMNDDIHSPLPPHSEHQPMCESQIEAEEEHYVAEIAEWTNVELLFVKAFIAALTSGLGGFPLYLMGDLPAHIMGFAITVAAGLMCGCSVVLFREAMEVEPSILWIVLYMLIGVTVIHFISHLVGHIEDFEFAGLKGASASKALLIILSMGLHSLGEGISVGVSATAERETIGLLVIISLAIHNIPEGIAVSLLLMNQGMNVWTSSIYAVLCNIPQPLIAIPSFMFLDAFKSVVPIGFAVASGAMTYIVCTELIPEAHGKISTSMLVFTLILSLGFVVAIALCAQ